MSYLEQARDLIKQAGNISVEQLPSAAVDLSALILKESSSLIEEITFLILPSSSLR